LPLVAEGTEPFDLVYDRGCYHGVRQQHAPKYVAAVCGLMHARSRVLIAVGNAYPDLPLPLYAV